MGKSTISMAIFNSYFDITRGQSLAPRNLGLGHGRGWTLSSHLPLRAASDARRKGVQTWDSQRAGGAGNGRRWIHI